MKISPARIAAFDILVRIETESAYSSVLLAAQAPLLSERDRSLCYEITLGTLRRQMLLDRTIDILAKGRKLDPEVRISIRIALYQILFLARIPAHSAVNDSVSLIVRARKVSAKGFVNGVLRTALRQMPTFNFDDELDRVSTETSHPRWLIEKWVGDIGLKEAAVRAAANNIIPAVALRVVHADERVERLLSDSRESTWVKGCYFLERFGEDAIELAAEGLIYFQDEASQMVARAIRVPVGGSFLDVCAAPGGKTAIIAGQYASDTCMLVAGDLHGSRVDLLKRNCDRQVSDAVRVVQYDAVVGLPFADETFDAILLDAPCSGTGTIRHNPELRYRLVADDLGRLATEQLAMLKNASKLLKPGGTLYYTTCSFEPEENESVCRLFVDQAPEVSRAAPNVPDRFITREGFSRTEPGRDAMDGFFAAAFAKA